MPVIIKDSDEIRRMRKANALLATVLSQLAGMVRPGISTMDINRAGENMIRKLGAVPGFLHYDGYPASVCVSVNDEVVHGIPSQNRILQEGDLVSLDTGLIYEGVYSDAARTCPVGRISPECRRLMDLTREAFFCGMKMARAGNHLYDISAAIGAFAEKNGLGIVRDLAGHGIGADMHEDPQIPNFDPQERGILLVPGMTLAVEPMLTLGDGRVITRDDGWTVATADGSMAAHYENTILITRGDPEILSLLEGGG
ncbi:MAG: type I methionyl aminopeptidase [Lachnospiraceae bacterium]|nr:type I methionyl aminopeptidase [Lachnospiraceae bacterium]